MFSSKRGANVPLSTRHKSSGAPSFASFAKGGIVTCSIGRPHKARWIDELHATARYFDFAKSSISPARQRLYAAGPSRYFEFLQAASIELRSVSFSIERSGRAGSAANLAI